MGSKLDADQLDELVRKVQERWGLRAESAVPVVREAFECANELGALKQAGELVDESELRKGDRIRVEYELKRPHNWLAGPDNGDGQTRIHMTAEHRYSGHGVTPYRYSLEQIVGLNVYRLEQTQLTVPEKPGHRFKAKTDRGWIEREFVTLVNDKIICVDEQDLTGEVWDRVPFEAAFTVTEVLS